MYLILGDSRSGTSLVARILHENGISFGDRFREANNTNPYGYFEDQDLKTFCDKVRFGRATKSEARTLVEKKPWGAMKNPPWLVYAYEYLEPYLPEHRFIVCNRNREEQWQSINKRINKLGKEKILDRIEQTHAKIDEITAGKPRLDIHFRRWFSDRSKQMRELCEFTGIAYRNELLSYIDSNLYRFKV